MCGVTETELEEKITPRLVLYIFWLTNTCAQICARGPGGADCQGDIFRSSFLSSLKSTPVSKEWGEGGCQVVVWCTLGLVLAQNPCSFNAFFGNSAVFP